MAKKYIVKMCGLQLNISQETIEANKSHVFWIKNWNCKCKLNSITQQLNRVIACTWKIVFYNKIHWHKFVNKVLFIFEI